MGQQSSANVDPSMSVEWMWQSNPDPSSKSQPIEWTHYPDVENLMIERAFSTKQSLVMLDDYYIDFKQKAQISKIDNTQLRPVKRVVCKRENRHLRQNRFVSDPIAPKRPFGNEYGWVSPFILEVREYLASSDPKLWMLPSENEEIVPVIVEKAGIGIIEEGRKIGKEMQANEIRTLLMEKKDAGMKEVWKRCAYLYSLESFLYQKLNEMMRLIGDDDKESVWRSKISTLGPFCLLLWDNPFNNRVKLNKQLYRGAKLTMDQINTYKDLSNHLDEYRSFQAFTSCSRNREQAEHFGNALFIMNIRYAFVEDISAFSEYPSEEEELITPGVCFRVTRVDFDSSANKYFIYLELKQCFAGEFH